MILERLALGDSDFEEAFHRHVHFGAWEDPSAAGTYTDEPDSIRAMDRLCQHLLQLAEVQDGQELLDVGCGFGGTLATIAEQFKLRRLTGLNIDGRQLEIARQRVRGVEFVEGDACAMPFPDRSFDRVLAVECIFHFPSRADFFGHAARVLRPGGNLTLSDFLQPAEAPPGLFDTCDDPLWGSHCAIDVEAYRKLGAEVGLELTHAADISRHVRPTYHWFGQLLGRHFPAVIELTNTSAFIMDAGGLGYCTLRFDRR